MSSIVVSGDTSGAVTLAVPAVAGTNTVTIAAQTGTINVAGPTFSAYQSSAQTLTSNVSAKIQYQTEEWDTASCFDSTTNYRFTPTVAGYYQINAGIQVASSYCQCILFIYKNGSRYKDLANYGGSGGAYGSATVYCNGSTDYIEIYGNLSTGQALDNRSLTTYFQGTLIRGA
jgi:hypothetical protein